MIDAGFYIEENVFSESECDRVIELLSSPVVRRSRAGVRNLMSLPGIPELRRMLAC